MRWRARRDPSNVDESVRQRWRLGLAAVALLAVGTGWYQAWSMPPYLNADEQAHAGYILTLLDGELPTVDEPIPAGDGGELLEVRVEGTKARYGDVWVANNPPLGYLPYLFPAAVERAVGGRAAPLMAIRLVNVTFFALAAALVARLGRRLSGDDPQVGLIAAGLFALLPHTAAIAGAGYIDGVGLACAVALLDAVAAAAVRTPSRRQVGAASLLCTFGVGTRPMTAAFALAAAALMVMIMGWRAVRSRRDDAPALRSVVEGALLLFLPATAASGWFYLRSVRLYGDATASTRLAAKFQLQQGRSAAGVLAEGPWAQPVRTLLNRRFTNAVPGPPLWLWQATRWTVTAAVGATVVLVVADQVRGRRRQVPPRTSALAWACTGALALLTVGLAAGHWVDGGRIHPRYLFPALAVVSITVAFTLCRMRLQWLAVALLVGTAVLHVHETPRSGYYRSLFQDPSSPLADPAGPLLVRLIGVPVAVAAAAALCWSIGSRRPTGEDEALAASIS